MADMDAMPAAAPMAEGAAMDDMVARPSEEAEGYASPCDPSNGP
jgi:hypothetical protein